MVHFKKFKHCINKYGVKYGIKYYYKTYSKFNHYVLILNLLKLFSNIFYKHCIEKCIVVDMNKNSDHIVYPRYNLCVKWNFKSDEQKELLSPIVFFNYKVNGKRRYYKNCNICISYRDTSDYRGYNYGECTKKELEIIYGIFYKILKHKGKYYEK